MLITPLSHPLSASVRVPGSKSLTNRALLLAALAEGTTTLENALFSDDSRYFAEALRCLGFEVTLDPPHARMTVVGLGGRIPAESASLFIGNAGTAARFLTAFLTLGRGKYLLDGDARMRERPIGDLVESLTQIGAKVRPVATENRLRVTDYSIICPPIEIHSSGLPGGKTKLAGHISSQFLSALLMVAPYARSPVEIEVTTELNSKPYVDMTLSIMQDFGVTVERQGYERFRISPARYSPLPAYPIESDASAASYFFAAAALCGGTVWVENISRASLQGDIRFLDVLEQMGCIVQEDGHSIGVSGCSPLRGLDMDMRDIPDTAQTLAAIAPFASSPTRIRGIASARLKETDRIHAVCVELQRLGVQVEEHDDGMTIYPCSSFEPAVVRTYNDHRMAMAFSLVGLRVPGIVIENPACVSKTFPNFFEVLATLSPHSPSPASLSSTSRFSAALSPNFLSPTSSSPHATHPNLLSPNSLFPTSPTPPSFFHLGLTGYPLGHSLSPAIHKLALAVCGLQGEYALFPVEPDDLNGLKALLARLRAGELHGLNVTIPHKQAVVPLLDELTPAAAAIGAVNTIYLRQNKLIGANTDAPGFLADLKRFIASIPNCASKISARKSALVLGAGGAARAVVYALVNDGWKVTVAARRLEQAQELARQYASRLTNYELRVTPYELRLTNYVSRITPHELRLTPPASPNLPEAALIVNATPLGMAPHTDASPWPAGLPFPPEAVVYDLVYNPQRTKLVREAGAAGLPAVTGLGMLVEQAALAFELWTGCLPPSAALFSAVAVH